jgi:hypothetical protein
VRQPESVKGILLADRIGRCEKIKRASAEIILSNRAGNIDLLERHCGTGDRNARYALGGGVSGI